TYGKTRFDSYAMGAGYFRSKASVGTPAARKEFFAKLRAYLDRARKTPDRVSPPVLAHLKDLGAKPELTADELNTLISIFPHVVPTRWSTGRGYERLPVLIHKGLMAAKRRNELYPLVPHFWTIARDTRDATLQRTLMQFARDLNRTKQYDLAAAYSAAGLDVMGGALAEDARSSLQVVRSKSVINIGGVIPVARSDRRYPVFAAQVSFFTGKFQSAWELTVGKQKLVLDMYRDLDPSFCLWLIDKHTETREYEQAEALSRAMMQWFESSGADFEPELRARLLVGYANVALARREFPRARAQFERIASSKDFAGTRAQRDAELKIADVDRLTRQFDRAIVRLENLLRRRDKHVQTEAYYGMARVKYDQEEFQEARDYLDQVFARVPDHANARILQGRLYLKMKRLVEATELKVGLSAARRFIIPGRPLKVNLADRNLSIVGKATAVEIRAWTKSGDEEFFTLHPFGDSKTKFQGQIPTAMAPVQKDDNVLQLLGGDTVHYDFSPRFKEANRIVLDEPHRLEVVTDGELYASSGRILSREERDVQALERLIRQRLEAGKAKADPTIALSTVRAENQIKPGNAINVRVVDPDRAVTAGKDSVEVEVVASSGDRIAAFTLVETETHSGIFEGAVPTASGQAVAFASDSEEGREPNHVICKKADYPAWVALPDSVRPKTFSVDLNDNVP
ncbi:tetratricopeptide repeat protein, partial [bacterium]|nr:tetratricopeptide repeat protein [bacterium]